MTIVLSEDGRDGSNRLVSTQAMSLNHFSSAARKHRW
jgi:hypothetical protein